MKIKRLMAGLLAGTMLLGFAACGSGTSGGGSESAAGGNSAAGETVRISWWGTQVVHEYTLEVCDKFTELTGIPLESEYASFGDYWQKMNTLAAAGDLPDIMRQDYDYIAQYAMKGLLEPLDEYVESGQIDLSNVDPATLDGGRVNGKLYGIHIGSCSHALVYNKELIEAAGMEVPGPEMTWQEYEDFCIEFAKRTGKYGGSINEMRDQLVVEFMIRGQGETFFDSTEPKLGYQDDTAVIEYFESVKRMQDQGGLPSIDTITQQTSIEDSPFALEEAATIITYTDVYPSLCEVMGKTLGITIIPGTGESKSMYAKPGQFLSIPVNSEHKEEAIKFINEWVNNQEINDILNGRRGVPISTVVADNLAEKANDVQKAVYDYMDELPKYLSSTPPTWRPAGTAEIQSEFENLFDMVMFGEISPEDAAVTLREKANEYLAIANS